MGLSYSKSDDTGEVCHRHSFKQLLFVTNAPPRILTKPSNGDACFTVSRVPLREETPYAPAFQSNWSLISCDSPIALCLVDDLASPLTDRATRLPRREILFGNHGSPPLLSTARFSQRLPSSSSSRCQKTKDGAPIPAEEFGVGSKLPCFLPKGGGRRRIRRAKISYGLVMVIPWQPAISRSLMA